MPDNPVKPYVLAMILCDTIYVERATQKKTLLGTFSTLFAPKMPAVIPGFALYMAMTDGFGQTPLRIEIVDCNEARPPIWEMNNSFNFTDPRMVAEICTWVSPIEFPEHGEYRVVLWSGNELLVERRIMVLNPEEPDEQK